MTNAHAIDVLLSASEPSTVAYIDGPGALPQVEEESMRDTVIARLNDEGAPSEDVDAIRRALPTKDGTPSPSARYLLARSGRIEVDRIFPGARMGPESLSFGPVPHITPLLRQLARSVRYVVVETGREGADVRLERADRSSPELIEEIEGRTDSLTKVQAGGLSHARYQRSAEEVWKHNQSEVAEVVDQIVVKHQPDFVVVAGDVRARQLLMDSLSEAASRLVIEYDTHTRADGSDDEGLEEIVAQAADQHISREIQDAVARAKTDDGSAGAQGASAVVKALQQAQVDTLVLDAQLVASDETLRALDTQPWVARDEPDGLDARTIAKAPIAEALARAAILTGARVLFQEEEFTARDEPRSDAEAAAPLAALRWTGESS
ncbi:MAG: baeRF2 domain-containing protein [Leucobacter sp.]